MNPDPNHTHADFAVYINGERLEFTDPKYMSNPPVDHEGSPPPEDTLATLFGVPQAIAHGDEDNEHVIPGREYLHLHDNNGNVIHSHKPDLTIGDFFTSIGFTMTKDCFILDTDISYCSLVDAHWRMFVNDTEVLFDPDYVFEDLNKILLTYGATDQQINE